MLCDVIKQPDKQTDSWAAMSNESRLGIVLSRNTAAVRLQGSEQTRGHPYTTTTLRNRVSSYIVITERYLKKITSFSLKNLFIERGNV